MSEKAGYDPRRSARLPVEIMAVVDQPRAQRRAQAELAELSREGCRLLVDEPFEPGAQLLVLVPGHEPWPARVIWVGEGGMGVEFHTPLPAALVADYGLRFQRGEGA